MRDSIIVDMKYADFDIINGQYGVERHHCLGGPNRKKADEDGLWVPLTPEHHRTGKINGRQNNRSRLTEPGKRSPGQGPSFIGGGICQAIRATDYKDPPKVLVESTTHTIKHCTK